MEVFVDDKTLWHPAFYKSALVTFDEYKDALIFESEHQLVSGPFYGTRASCPHSMRARRPRSIRGYYGPDAEFRPDRVPAQADAASGAGAGLPVDKIAKAIGIPRKEIKRLRTDG
jgi:hypothetical protein